MFQICALAGLILAAISPPDDYHGWQDAVRLSNGLAEVVVVPQIGRIMRFAAIGGPNLLWENPDLVGKPPVASKDWQNYGGDKLWPAPQKSWGWPPDPAIDPGNHSVKAANNKIIMDGSAGTNQQVRYHRELYLTPGKLELIVLNRMTNVGSVPLETAVWEITQVDDPEKIIVPAYTKQPFQVFADSNQPGEFVSVAGGEVVCRRNPKLSYKVGALFPKGTAACYKSGWRLEISLSPAGSAGKPMPHGYANEVYSNPDPAKYMEMELLTPLSTLMPGKSISAKTVWRLSKAGSGGN